MAGLPTHNSQDFQKKIKVNSISRFPTPKLMIKM